MLAEGKQRPVPTAAGGRAPGLTDFCSSAYIAGSGDFGLPRMPVEMSVIMTILDTR